MEASVQAQEEAKEAELSRKELGLEGGVDSLKALIQVKAASGPARVLCVCCLECLLELVYLCFSFKVQLHVRYSIFWGFEYIQFSEFNSHPAPSYAAVPTTEEAHTHY